MSYTSFFLVPCLCALSSADKRTETSRISSVAPAAESGADLPSADAIRQQHESIWQSIASAVIYLEDVVTIEHKPIPSVEAIRRDNLLNAIDERARRSRAALSDPWDAGAIEQIELSADELRSQVDEVIRVGDLNKVQVQQRKRYFDVSRPRAREEIRDLRDVTRLASYWALTPAGRATLDQSGVTLRFSDYGVRIPPINDITADVSPHQRLDLNAVRLEFGVLPTWAFSDEFDLAVDRIGDSTEGDVRLTGRRAGRPVFVALLDPDLGYRVRRLAVYRGDGGLFEEIVLGNYQVRSGLVIPFELARVQDHPEVTRFRTEERRIKSVRRLNTAEESSVSYEIPSGFAVIGEELLRQNQQD